MDDVIEIWWLLVIVNCNNSRTIVGYLFFFFSIRVFFTDTDDSQDSREREGTIYSTLPLPPAHEH